MSRTKKLGPVARFRERGGVSLRKIRAEIEKSLKQLHVCPQCRFRAVRRYSVGIWKCRKCGFTFAGGAYTPTTKIGMAARRLKKTET
ncbi:50S ribosomal protein L37ae [Candidatus Bathyarchaeota archaeon]|nr:MAG: 50S ribosomal protein L37ae [Candidatus Bathyarchaeota archaeon]